MNIVQYQVFTATTFICNHDQSFALMRCALGLSNEYIEYRLSETLEDAVKELGDIAYYVAMIANCLKHRIEPEPNSDQLGYNILRLCESVKKYYRDDSVAIYGEDMPKLVNQLWFVLQTFPNFDKVIEANVEKLSSRKARGVIQGSGDNR